jgi:hypothetical protein
MGKRAAEARRVTRRTVRPQKLTDDEKAHLRANARYEGVSYHKRSPGDFGLTPPAAPRPDKTLCDEAAVMWRAEAQSLLDAAIDAGLVSENEGAPGFPKHLWVVRDDGQVFEAMYGGSTIGAYHGYPIRRNDPFFDELTARWKERT